MTSREPSEFHEPEEEVDPTGQTRSELLRSALGEGQSATDWWARILAILAIVVAIAGIYFSELRINHRFAATLSGFFYDPRDESMSLDLVFSNGGNQYEAVLSARFTLPWGSSPSGTSWPGVPQVTLEPLVLEPGAVTARRLVQPMPSELLIQHKKTNASSGLFVDPDHQDVALEVVVRDTKGRPLRHRFLIAKAGARGEGAGPWEIFGNVPGEPGSSAVLTVDLLTGGTIGIPLSLTPKEYRSGEVGESGRLGAELGTSADEGEE